MWRYMFMVLRPYYYFSFSMFSHQIVEKSADGWWTGRVDGNVGVFPASFVEMIQIPKTKDERKRLLKRFHQGRLGEGAGADVAGKECGYRAAI